MRDHGATVVAVADPELATLRTQRGIPSEVVTCHAALVDEYVVEGHVPVEAIARLLADRPDAVGIAVQGMPSDSPGMGGDADAWAEMNVLLMERDGRLTPWEF